MIQRNLPGWLLLALTFLASWWLAQRTGNAGTAASRAFPLVVQFAGLCLVFGWMWWRARRSLLRELYDVLETLDEFDPRDPGQIDFRRTREPALRELHQNLHNLIGRVRENYRASKQFSQNAAHELQTPLAAIKTNVELLLQSPHLNESDAEALATILHNTNRLSRLNQALILLSRIESRHFSDDEPVDIEKVTEEVLHHFQDLIEVQELTIRRDYRNSIQLRMSATLAEILIANLLQNAIRHNQPGGYIDLRIEDRSLILVNPGEILNVAPAQLFRRFQRQSTSEDSLGLGLSIVKRICDRYGFEITYLHPGNIHQLIIRFPEGHTDNESG